MTREIDPDDIANENLSYEEYEYLRVRGRLPKGYPAMDPPDDEGGEDDEDQSEYLPSRVTPLEDQSVPVMGNRGGIVEDSGELDGVGGNYSNEEGWNNDKRRAELAKRGLSVAGNKEVMISRLRRFDSEELYDDDYETTDESESE